MYLSVTGMAVFTKFFIILLIVSGVMPSSLDSIPVFGQYLLGNMFLLALAMFLSSAICKIHDTEPHTHMHPLVEKVGLSKN